MGQRPQHDLGDKATALLATTFVVFGGAAVCALIATAFSSRPSERALTLGAVFAAMLLLLWVLRERPRNELKETRYFWLLRRRPKRQKTVVEIRFQRPRKPTQYGTNRPPTAEQIRELRENVNTWVPASAPPRRRSQPR